MGKENQCISSKISKDTGFLLPFVLHVLATHKWWSLSRREWLIPKESVRRVEFYVCVCLAVEVFVLVNSHMACGRWGWAVVFLIVIAYRLLDIGFVLLGILLDPRSSWLSAERLVLLAVINYIELIISFAALYRISDVTFANAFNKPLASSLDAIYFSSVTATTLGYGDFFPEHFSTKICVIGELLLVVLVVVSAIGFFLSLKSSSMPDNRGIK